MVTKLVGARFTEANTTIATAIPAGSSSPDIFGITGCARAGPKRNTPGARTHRREIATPARPGSMMGAVMADIVNLKRFKKRVEREESAKQAEANRTKFGRTKSERTSEQRRASRANELLDQHRIDGEDAS